MYRKKVRLSPLYVQDDWFKILYQYKEYKEVTNVTFLGLRLDRHMAWEAHVEQIIPKISSAYYAFRFMYYFSNVETLKSYLLCLLPFSNEMWNYILGQF
jgi:hypothetical protein